MTTPVKEQLSQDWQKAQEVGQQRVARLREILKAASSEALSELKEGTSEIKSVGRSTLANLIIQLKEAKLGEEGTIPDQMSDEDTGTIAIAHEVPTAHQPESTASLPTWRQLLKELFGVIRNRRTDLKQFFRLQFNRYVERVDSDLSEEYGDRYQRLKEQFKKAQVRARAAKPQAEAPATHVEVEVLDD